MLQDRLSRLEPRVRRRLRGKFSALVHAGPSDLDDVLSSARRRLDEGLVLRRITVPGPDARLAGLLQRTAEHIAVDVLRREGLRSQAEASAPERRKRGRRDRPEQALDPLYPTVAELDDNEKQILELRGHGMSHEQIAAEIGITVSAHQRRWRRLKARIMSSRGARDPR